MIQNLLEGLTTKKIVLIFLLIGFATFFNVLTNSFVLDDNAQITNNSLVQSLSNWPLFFSGSTFNTGGSTFLAGNYYRPLMSTYFSLMYTFFGQSTFPYHFFQIFLHCAVSFLVFLLFKKFFNRTISFFLALVFLIHPINQEAVAYVSDIEDLMFMFFGLLATLIALDKKRGWKDVTSITLLLILSMLSKEAGIIFVPIIILVYSINFRQKAFLTEIILVVMTAIYLYVRFFLVNFHSASSLIFPMMKLPLWNRLLSLPKIFHYYISTFVFPQNLATHQLWTVSQIDFPSFWFPTIICALFALTLIILAVRIYNMEPQKIWQFIFFLLFFSLGLSLYLQIIPLEMTVETSWFYFPIVGLLGLIGLAVQNLKFKSNRLNNHLLAPLLIVIFVFMIRTISRNGEWTNELTLAQSDIKTEDNFAWENNLGDALFAAGQFEQSRIHFARSVTMNRYWSNLYNLGAAEFKLKNFTQAAAHMKESLKYGDYYLSYENLSYILLFSGHISESEYYSQLGLKELPLNARLWYLNGLAQYQLGNQQQAITSVVNSLRLDPSNQERIAILRVMRENRKITLNK